jgi:hypothetical protein
MVQAQSQPEAQQETGKQRPDTHDLHSFAPTRMRAKQSRFCLNIALQKFVLSSSSQSKEAAVTVHLGLVVIGHFRYFDT